MSSANQKKKTVLIIGGSFGGLTAAKTLGKKFNIIVVDRKSFFEFTPSFHYALQDINYIDRITADISSFASKNKFTFIKGNVIELNANSAIVSKAENATQTIQFDYCIISTGSNYSSQVKSIQEFQTLDERKEQIRSLISTLKSSKNILVVGGGAVGVEIAGVVKDQFKHVDVSLWTKPAELLPQFPKRARRLAHNSLTQIGVKVEYEKSITSLPEQDFDYIFDCRGNIYTPNFMKKQEFKQYVDSKGRIVVDEFMRLENHLHIYCIGDACITPNNEPKMCYNAIIQGQFAAQNIQKTEKRETSFKKLVDSANIYNITTRRRSAILCLGENLAFESCIVHYIKMMIEYVTSQSFKGSEVANIAGYLQRQLLIFMATIFSLINKKKVPQNTDNLNNAYHKIQ